MVRVPYRTARVELRLAPDALAVLKRAAGLQRRGVADFVATAARDAANRTLADAKRDSLPLDDQDTTSEHEDPVHPDEPNDALRRAVAAYRAF